VDVDVEFVVDEDVETIALFEWSAVFFTVFGLERKEIVVVGPYWRHLRRLAEGERGCRQQQQDSG
jgi:hypothetical protein